MRLALYKNMPARTMIAAGVVWLALGLLPSAAQGEYIGENPRHGRGALRGE